MQKGETINVTPGRSGRWFLSRARVRKHRPACHTVTVSIFLNGEKDLRGTVAKVGSVPVRPVQLERVGYEPQQLADARQSLLGGQHTKLCPLMHSLLLNATLE